MNIPHSLPTMEEYQDKEKYILEEVNYTLQNLDENLSIDDMIETIDRISQFYFAMDSAPPDFIEEYNKKIGKLIIDHGKSVPIACDNIIKIINENPETEKNFDMIYNCSSLLRNYSVYSDLFCQELCKQEEFIKFMAEKLFEWAADHLQRILSKEKEKLTEAFLSIAHNMVKLPENVNIFRKYGYVKAVEPYLKSQNKEYEILALMTLAGILTEEECDLIKTNEDSIKFLLSKLSNAIANPNRRNEGRSAAELGRAIGRIAKNDSNKKLLVQLGALPLLLDLTTSDIKIEQEESIEALWMLAFDEENKPKMVAEPNLIETIDKLQKTTEGNVKELCNGIFWTLRNILKKNDKFKHLETIKEKSFTDEEVKIWTSQQVASWLKQHNLNRYEKLTKLSGKEIIFLRKIKIEAPEYFYKTLESKLRTHLGAMADFTEALEDLLK